MVVPHSGGYPHAKFEGNLLLFKFGPLTKSGLTIPQCVRVLARPPVRILPVIDWSEMISLVTKKMFHSNAKCVYSYFPAYFTQRWILVRHNKIGKHDWTEIYWGRKYYF